MIQAYLHFSISLKLIPDKFEDFTEGGHLISIIAGFDKTSYVISIFKENSERSDKLLMSMILEIRRLSLPVIIMVKIMNVDIHGAMFSDPAKTNELYEIFYSIFFQIFKLIHLNILFNLIKN